MVPFNGKLISQLYTLKVQNRTRTNRVLVPCLVSGEESLLVVKVAVEVVVVQWPLEVVMEVAVGDEHLSAMAVAVEQFSSDTGNY
jgi:hypothetical protein